MNTEETTTTAGEPAGETTTTALSKSSALGQAIVGEARERHNKEVRDKCLAGVQALLQHRDEALLQVRHWQRSADWYKKKLDALEAGAFQIDERAKTFIFDDADLNRANY